MSAKGPEFDLTPYKTATKRPGWASALIAAAVLALIGVITAVAGTGFGAATIWVAATAFIAATVCALIALIAYLSSRH